MPRGVFHGIYLDYLCGCALRVAREIFALLPVDTVLITAAADTVDSHTGQTLEQPVLSTVFPRPEFARLNFDQLDPSDAVELFQCRGDFKTSRKAEAFQANVPFTPGDIKLPTTEDVAVHELLGRIHEMRDQLKSELARLNQSPSSQVPQTDFQP